MPPRRDRVAVKTLSREDARAELRLRPQAYDLFCGVGGMGLGLEQAGFDVSIAVELDDITGSYAQFNLPTSEVLYGEERGNVRALNRESFVAARKDRRVDDVALISGGPPCQGFSLAGRMNSADPRNGLVSAFATVVLSVMPLAFCIENVPGIVRGNTSALARALRRLRKEYEVADPACLWAHDYGVPQARERVFVIGVRRDLGVLPSFPEPTHAGSVASRGKLVPVTVKQAIYDLPSAVFSEDGTHTVLYDKPALSKYAKRMRATSPSADDLSLRVEWDEKLCRNMAGTSHGPDVLSRFKKLAQGAQDPVSGVYRLRPTGVGSTIRAGTTAEHGSRSAPRPVHPTEPRVLTTRECARLQSFPDWFEFHPTRWHGNRQVGNAVPPIMAKTIGKHILSLLKLEPKELGALPPIARDRTKIAEASN